jgi:hypothetical protein
MKTRYFMKDLGDGTSVELARMRRPDDDNMALAIRFKLSDGRMLNCFLEDKDGNSFVDELCEGLTDFLCDVEEQNKRDEETKKAYHEEMKKLESAVKD